MTNASNSRFQLAIFFIKFCYFGFKEPNLDDLRSDLLAAKEEISAFRSPKDELVISGVSIVAG